MYGVCSLCVAMPRPRRLQNVRRINISLENEVHRLATARAKEIGLRGGFSELVSRVLVAELSRKRDIAHHSLRRLPSAEGAA